MICVWHSVIRACKQNSRVLTILLLTIPKLFTILFFVDVVRCLFPCYMYRSNVIYGFSMKWSFWDGKSGWCHSKYSKFFTLTVTVEAALFFFRRIMSAYFQIRAYLILFRLVERSGHKGFIHRKSSFMTTLYVSCINKF